MAFLNMYTRRPVDPGDTEPADPVPDQVPTPEAPPTGPGLPGIIESLGGGGGHGGGQNQTAAYPYPMSPDIPGFNPPGFTAPTAEQAYQEPGFQFRLQTGENALEHSAAARGALRTGGTLKDILDYGQNFASQEYGNVFNRALSSYDRLYQGAKDKYAPQLAKAMAEFQRQWELYSFTHKSANVFAPPGYPAQIPSAPFPKPGP